MDNALLLLASVDAMHLYIGVINDEMEGPVKEGDNYFCTLTRVIVNPEGGIMVFTPYKIRQAHDNAVAAVGNIVILTEPRVRRMAGDDTRRWAHNHRSSGAFVVYSRSPCTCGLGRDHWHKMNDTRPCVEDVCLNISPAEHEPQEEPNIHFQKVRSKNKTHFNFN